MWPFRRQEATQDEPSPEEALVERPTHESVPSGAWRNLPPIQRLMAPIAPAVDNHFDAQLATWRSPLIMRSLDHGISATAPSGLVLASAVRDARARTESMTTGVGEPPEPSAFVQRSVTFDAPRRPSALAIGEAIRTLTAQSAVAQPAVAQPAVAQRVVDEASTPLEVVELTSAADDATSSIADELREPDVLSARADVGDGNATAAALAHAPLAHAPLAHAQLMPAAPTRPGLGPPTFALEQAIQKAEPAGQPPPLTLAPQVIQRAVSDTASIEPPRSSPVEYPRAASVTPASPAPAPAGAPLLGAADVPERLGLGRMMSGGVPSGPPALNELDAQRSPLTPAPPPAPQSTKFELGPTTESMAKEPIGTTEPVADRAEAIGDEPVLADSGSVQRQADDASELESTPSFQALPTADEVPSLNITETAPILGANPLPESSNLVGPNTGGSDVSLAGVELPALSSQARSSTVVQRAVAADPLVATDPSEIEIPIRDAERLGHDPVRETTPDLGGATDTASIVGFGAPLSTLQRSVDLGVLNIGGNESVLGDQSLSRPATGMAQQTAARMVASSGLGSTSVAHRPSPIQLQPLRIGAAADQGGSAVSTAVTPVGWDGGWEATVGGPGGGGLSVQRLPFGFEPSVGSVAEGSSVRAFGRIVDPTVRAPSPWPDSATGGGHDDTSLGDTGDFALRNGVAQRQVDGSIVFGASPDTAGPPTVQLTGEQPAASPTAPGAPAAAGPDLDELAQRLYSRLRLMLKHELRLDRERAGQLTQRR
jgi:hypothetical protein